MKNREQLSNSELSGFCGQLYMVSKAGISMGQGLELMGQEPQSKKEQELLLLLGQAVDVTGSLYAALKEVGGFPDYFVEMVKIGEQSGKLSEVFRSLEQYYQREADYARAMKSAVSYPLLMLGMMFGIMVILITKIMPVFQQVFQEMGSELEGLPAVILYIGSGLKRYSLVFWGILLVLVLWYAVGNVMGTKKGQAHRILGKLPAFGRIGETVSAGRFAAGMALTLSSGMSYQESLGLSMALLEEGTFKKKLEPVCGAARQQQDIFDSMLQQGIFKGIQGRMLLLGKKTGNLETALEKIAADYQEQAEDEITGMISMVEPILLVVLSVTVGVILLSVMVPLLGILSQMM